MAIFSYFVLPTNYWHIDSRDLVCFVFMFCMDSKYLRMEVMPSTPQSYVAFFVRPICCPSVVPQSERWQEKVIIVSLFIEHPPCASYYCGIWEKCKSHWHKYRLKRTGTHMEPHVASLNRNSCASFTVFQREVSRQWPGHVGTEIFLSVDWAVKSWWKTERRWLTERATMEEGGRQGKLECLFFFSFEV